MLARYPAAGTVSLSTLAAAEADARHRPGWKGADPDARRAILIGMRDANLAAVRNLEVVLVVVLLGHLMLIGAMFGGGQAFFTMIAVNGFYLGFLGVLAYSRRSPELLCTRVIERDRALRALEVELERNGGAEGELRARRIVEFQHANGWDMAAVDLGEVELAPARLEVAVGRWWRLRSLKHLSGVARLMAAEPYMRVLLGPRPWWIVVLYLAGPIGFTIDTLWTGSPKLGITPWLWPVLIGHLLAHGRVFAYVRASAKRSAVRAEEALVAKLADDLARGIASGKELVLPEPSLAGKAAPKTTGVALG